MNLLRLILATGLLFVLPVLIGVAFGFAQLGIYRLLVRAGWRTAEDVPMFPILFLRGMMALLAVIAGHVFYYQFGGQGMWFVDAWRWIRGG